MNSLNRDLCSVLFAVTFCVPVPIIPDHNVLCVKLPWNIRLPLLRMVAQRDRWFVANSPADRECGGSLQIGKLGKKVGAICVANSLNRRHGFEMCRLPR